MQYTLLVDDPALNEAQIIPDAAIPLALVVGFELPDTLEQAFMAFGDLAREASSHSSNSLLFVHARVGSPTRVFRRVFSHAR
jgi:hypothetical protein